MKTLAGQTAVNIDTKSPLFGLEFKITNVGKSKITLRDGNVSTTSTGRNSDAYSIGLKRFEQEYKIKH